MAGNRNPPPEKRLPDDRRPQADRCRLIIADAIWTELSAHLLGSDLEQFAYLLGRAEITGDRWGRRAVTVRAQRALLLPDAALTVQSPTRVEVATDISRTVLRTCYEHALSLIDVHSHPGTSAPAAFSGTDRANTMETHREFHATIPARPLVIAASLVLTHTGVDGLWFNPRTGRLTPLDISSAAHALIAQRDESAGG
ncbi:Mov34/MPN/PAD-1 family protein [Frankia sp. Cr1]|uniref:Mov34/MPN/PAD-1 family protein n=1 Tax=Frankia sp. Cr1 TaxID=3073931 RepID=UPI002AD2B118|nr:Mov34/MPN/PAD-1 family protein [Frankia sp. Cr1]